MVLVEGAGGHLLVTEFRGLALNDLFRGDALRSLDLPPPLTDFIFRYYYPVQEIIKIGQCLTKLQPATKGLLS